MNPAKGNANSGKDHSHTRLVTDSETSSSGRERLLGTAAELFYRHGTHLGVNKLFECSGVSRVTFYKYFLGEARFVGAVLERSAATWPLAWLVSGGFSFTLTGGRAARALPEPAERPPGSPGEIFGAALLPSLVVSFLFGLGYVAYITSVVAILRDQGAGAGQMSSFGLALGASTFFSAFLWGRLLEGTRGGWALALLLVIVAVGAATPPAGLEFAAGPFRIRGALRRRFLERRVGGDDPRPARPAAARLGGTDGTALFQRGTALVARLVYGVSGARSLCDSRATVS